MGWCRGFDYIRRVTASDSNKCPRMRAFLEKMVLQNWAFTQVMDRKIEDEARNSFSFRKLLGGRVAATVVNGTVSLSGSVRDDEERCLAVETCRSLAGVMGVTDELHVIHSVDGSVSEIIDKIRSRLMAKANVNAESITIEEVSGGIGLSGIVDNAVRRTLVETLVQETVGGLVVRNDIRVDPCVRVSPLEEFVDDASLSGLVRSALLFAGLLADVKIEAGFVVLSGVAVGFSECSAIGAIAQSFQGVKLVTNEMSIA